MITWHSAHALHDGVCIKSPLSGYVWPITSHPDLIYNANVLPTALCIQLTQGTLLAPFNGKCEMHLQYGRRISIKHRNGLTMHIEFSNAFYAKASMRKLLTSADNVLAGQQLLTFSLPAHRHSCYAAIMLALPSGVTEVMTSQRLVNAGADTLLVLKQHSDEQIKE